MGGHNNVFRTIVKAIAGEVEITNGSSENPDYLHDIDIKNGRTGFFAASVRPLVHLATPFWALALFIGSPAIPSTV